MNIAISAKKRGGKDTVGRWLEREYGYTPVYLAEPLKRAVCEMFSFSWEQVVDEKLKEVIDPRWKFTPRAALENMGSAIRRTYGNDIFIRLFLARCDELEIRKGKKFKFVCCDLRYPDEAFALRQRGWKLLRIERPRVYDAFGSRQHDSQIALDTFKEFDVRIMNDNTLEVLFQRVVNAFDLVK